MSQGCRTKLAKGQWWNFCGETDMGQTLPALCTKCGGEHIRADDPDWEAKVEDLLALNKKQMEVIKAEDKLRDWIRGDSDWKVFDLGNGAKMAEKTYVGNSETVPEPYTAKGRLEIEHSLGNAPQFIMIKPIPTINTRLKRAIRTHINPSKLCLDEAQEEMLKDAVDKAVTEILSYFKVEFDDVAYVESLMK